MILSLAFLLALVYNCICFLNTYMRYVFLILILMGSFFSCFRSTQENVLFKPLTPQNSGIDFTNTLEYTEQLNPYTFKNFYNGGGVAIGDINNDGLADIFFSGNMVSNKLYLNLGGLRFEDITVSAGLESKNVWSTGVSMVDINADGFLDIYVCKSGPPGGEKRYNELFINNGNLTFTEGAKDYGLDHIGLSVHAAFFDYDKDGDLDCYLLNNSIKSIGSFEIIKDWRLIPDTLGGNKLFRNDNGYFIDVTLESGIYSSEIGFGLGAMVGDINDDNWPDIYISNDFFEKDYLYINQQDGTFKDLLEDYVKEISMGSMGADLADINNDGNPEYFVTEMLPERRDRLVTKAFFETWDEQKYAQSKGYFNQFGRNVLQLNNGDGTFSEIGRYAGVEATDWSWAALIFDMDNDGLKDIFVSNGIYKDLLDLDYLSFMADPARVRGIIQTNKNAIKFMIDMMPSEPIPNYIFKNNGDLTFTNKADVWGMGEPTFSNGSAYGDLDNDGDLDLVVNNVNMPSMIYENRSRQVLPERNYLALKLKGMGMNTMAIGAKVRLYMGDEIIYQEQNPMRGFESTVDYQMVFGLGENAAIDSLSVTWPNDRITTLYNVEVNQLIELNAADGKLAKSLIAKRTPQLFKHYLNDSLAFTHVENDYVDFNNDRLLFHMNSTEGPCVCKGDINNDGMDDLYVGGAIGQSGKLFIQAEGGTFRSSSKSFEMDRQSEDLDCAFFDANGDGYLDLYVTSGSSEFSSFSVWLNDRLYFGDGKGNFKKSEQRLPDKGFESTSVVVPFDMDMDGDLDLFIGGRSVPYYYGIPANSYLLENNGLGVYKNVTDQKAAALNRIGMVTDATLADLNADNSPELVVVGRWMPITVFSIKNGQLEDVSRQWELEESNGWYNVVKAADLNNDGRDELIVGNHGLNSRFWASMEAPIRLLVNDFDNNGTFEQIISMNSGEEWYPFVQLKDLSMQLPAARQRYPRFNDYKWATTEDVFPRDPQNKDYTLSAYNLATGIYMNNGGKLTFHELPIHAQLSPTYAIYTDDFNGDGLMDIIFGGNFSESKPEAGTYQACYGALFQGQENGDFKFVPAIKSGIRIDGDIRDIEEIIIDGKRIVLFTRNNREIYLIEYNEEK